MRPTSIEAYKKIKESGLLSQRRFQVYEALCEIGRATKNEISKHLHLKGIRINPNLVSARLVELRDLDVVYEVKERACKVSEMTIIEWDLTDRLPKKIKKPKKIKCKHCNGKGVTIEKQMGFSI